MINDLEVSESTADSMTLTWSAPYDGQSPIIEYTVHINSEDSTETVVVQDTLVAVAALPNTRYSILV
jgi:hypothetical protein